MNIHYAKTDPHELLLWVTWETQCLLDLRRENQAEIDSAQNTPEALESPDALPQWMDTGITLYRQCIPLIGKAWGIKSEAEAALLGLRESAPTTKDEEDTWTPVDEQLMKLLWGLFETCIRLGRKNNRKRIYRLAQEITDFHGLDIRFGPCVQIVRLQNAQDLQDVLALEALGLLTQFGSEIDVSLHEKVISLVGEAWQIPEDVTKSWLDMIAKEQDLPEAGSTNHGCPHTKQPSNKTRAATLDKIWWLFETAVRLKQRNDREDVFRLAVELPKLQGLAAWVIEPVMYGSSGM